MIPGSSAGEDPPVGGLRLVVGLGNPGPDYQGSRHNVGFEIFDLLAGKLGGNSFGLRAGGRRLGEILRVPDRKCVLLRPLTFMNRSGTAVAAAADQLEVEPASILVVSDDFHLPLGSLRLRSGGTCGGHNGLRSIEESLGTSAFPRLRVGVGEPRGNAVDHVLTSFRSAERPLLEETLQEATLAAETWAVHGVSFEELQARTNRRPPQADP